MQVYKYFGNNLACFLTVSLDEMKAYELMLGCIVHMKELILAIPIPFFTIFLLCIFSLQNYFKNSPEIKTIYKYCTYLKYTIGKL